MYSCKSSENHVCNYGYADLHVMMVLSVPVSALWRASGEGVHQPEV